MLYTTYKYYYITLFSAVVVSNACLDMDESDIRGEFNTIALYAFI